MARVKRGKWLQRHLTDPYVKHAQQDGFRSRAAYKLLEIDGKDRLFKKGQCVVDLGAAPGGWSQVAAQRVGETGFVLAVDCLAMDALSGVIFVQGDFTEEETEQQLLHHLADRKVDLVLSDMAPNLTGMKTVDQPKALYLNKLALWFAEKTLAPGGDLLMKVFEGAGVEQLRQQLRCFDKVIVRKPAASRSSSRENYLLARGYNK